MTIAEIGKRAEGFRGENLAQGLNETFGTPVSEAIGGLLIAEHLYRRKMDVKIDLPDAVIQLATIAAQMDPPIEPDDKRKAAITEVLSFKRDYEVSLAASKVVVQGPPFVGMNGSWGVIPVQISDGEFVQIPVLSLSLTWHDAAENHHEVFLQMVSQDWEDFTEKIDSLTASRNDAAT